MKNEKGDDENEESGGEKHGDGEEGCGDLSEPDSEWIPEGRVSTRRLGKVVRTI